MRLTVNPTSIGHDIGMDPEEILATSHGRRSIDVLKDLSPEKANWDCPLPPQTASRATNPRLQQT
jgi:hypothetical protein